MAKAMMDKGGMCPCPHHKIMPLFAGLLIVIGGIVLWVKAAGSLSMGSADRLLAALVVVFGLGVMSKGACKCCTWK
jgi:hypothetical protein